MDVDFVRRVARSIGFRTTYDALMHLVAISCDLSAQTG
jgi:hypothetical protein